MSAWIGPPGGLVEVLQLKGSLSVDQSKPTSYRTTLGGRVKQQRGRRSRRTWDASAEYLRPSEVAGLYALEEAGTPPWYWVDPYAQVTNLFTPEQSTLAPGSWFGAGFVEGGPVMVGGAYIPRSVAHPDGGSIDFGWRDGVAERPPVLPGVPVSVSAYVRGSGVLAVSWRDWSNSIISEQTASYSNTSIARVSGANLIPPPGAATVRLWVTGARQATMPQMTWTTTAPAWSIGRGCTRAVVEGLGESLQSASTSSESNRYSALSFTVREVG